MTVKRRISLYLKGVPKAEQVLAVIELEMPADQREFEHEGVRYRIEAHGGTVHHQPQAGLIVTEAWGSEEAVPFRPRQSAANGTQECARGSTLQAPA